MWQRNEGTFTIDKYVRLIAINRESTMTLTWLIAIKHFNRLTALLTIPALSHSDDMLRVCVFYKQRCSKVTPLVNKHTHSAYTPKHPGVFKPWISVQCVTAARDPLPLHWAPAARSVILHNAQGRQRHADVDTHIHTYTHTYTQAHVNAQATHTLAYKCIKQTSAHTQTHTRTNTHRRAHTETHTHMCVNE